MEFFSKFVILKKNLKKGSDKMLNLGDYIKYYRDKAGLSQENLGRYVDISQKQISNIESNNIKQPHRNTLRKISKALDCSYEKLLSLAGYQTNWQEAEILIDDKPLDEKIEEIVEKSLEKFSLKIIEEMEKRMGDLEKKFLNLSLAITGGGKKIPLLPPGNCGPAAVLIPPASKLIEIPIAWDADFAFIAEGQSMETYKIFDFSTVYVKRQEMCQVEDIAVIHIEREGQYSLVLKKCKGDEENKIFLDSRGNLFKPCEKSIVTGKVIKVMNDFE